MKEDREHRILDLLLKGEPLRSDQAARHFGVSSATIRRDFETLAQRGIVRRFHGGILLAEGASAPELPIDLRKSRDTAEKAALAILAARELPEEGTVFIDGGSTTAMLGTLLTNPRLRIITNSITLLKEFQPVQEPKAQLILTGGTYNGKFELMMGVECVRFLQNRHADLAIVSGGAIDETGVYDSNEESAGAQRVMAENADAVMVISPPFKLGQKSSCLSIPAEKITTLVTDFAPDKHPVIAALRRKGVRIRMPVAETL